MTSTNISLQQCKNLTDIATFVAEKNLKATIPFLGGRRFQQVGSEDTICFKDIVQKVDALFSSLKNDSLEEWERNCNGLKGILRRIENLDTQAENLHKSSWFPIRILTKLRQWLGNWSFKRRGGGAIEALDKKLQVENSLIEKAKGLASDLIDPCPGLTQALLQKYQEAGSLIDLTKQTFGKKDLLVKRINWVLDIPQKEKRDAGLIALFKDLEADQFMHLAYTVMTLPGKNYSIKALLEIFEQINWPSSLSKESLLPVLIAEAVGFRGLSIESDTIYKHPLCILKVKRIRFIQSQIVGCQKKFQTLQRIPDILAQGIGLALKREGQLVSLMKDQQRGLIINVKNTSDRNVYPEVWAPLICHLKDVPSIVSFDLLEEDTYCEDFEKSIGDIGKTESLKLFRDVQKHNLFQLATIGMTDKQKKAINIKYQEFYCEGAVLLQRLSKKWSTPGWDLKELPAESTDEEDVKFRVFLVEELNKTLNSKEDNERVAGLKELFKKQGIDSGKFVYLAYLFMKVCQKRNYSIEFFCKSLEHIEWPSADLKSTILPALIAEDVAARGFTIKEDTFYPIGFEQIKLSLQVQDIEFLTQQILGRQASNKLEPISPT
jgi:hypothetical protein